MAERDKRGVAIVGMAALFPGARDLAAFEQNLAAGADAFRDAPPDRIDPAFYDPASTAPDRLYCRRGGFLPEPVRFDAASFGIMPIAAQGAEPDQLLALDLAARALADAGYADRPFARDKASVILGRGGYLTPGVARLDQRVRAAEQLVQSLRALLPDLPDDKLAAVRAEVQAGLGPFGPDTAIGLVPNLAASRIANRLDLGGSAYTIDAACASSLVAVDHACRDLHAHRADLVLAGGVHLCHDPGFWSVFCQLGALSRSGQIRPFDRRADGLLIGEGVGVLALKRLADAERDGDRIYAVIRGTGTASDGRGASLMSPDMNGQIAALRRAWDDAGLDPSLVGMIEAHGTGTAAGDGAELGTLARVFGPARADEARAALGSVKSMIGHTMPAAGAAGLIKAALALHHARLYPSLHCEEPRAEVEATRFRILSRAEPWESPGRPRVAGVNAFGFGGINAHVVLEEHPASRPSTSPRASSPSSTSSTSSPTVVEPVLFLAAESPAALCEALDAHDAHNAHDERAASGPARLALFNPTPERRARARAIVARGEPWRGRDDLWFSAEGLLARGGRVAFLFPGVDSSFDPRVDDVASRFGLPLSMPEGKRSLKDLGMGIIAVGRLLDAALRRIGVYPAMIAGHSIGEWSGMIASEMIPRDEIDGIIARLAPESVSVPGVTFIAAGCGLDKAIAAMEGLPEIAVSHDNCPHQLILCGIEASADIALDRLKKMGVLSQKLPFQSGYHSRLFHAYTGPHRRILAGLPLTTPAVPLWSATTCAPYPADPEAIRRLAVQHILEPVRFRELTLALHEAGARAFIQVGTGSLIGFVGDTLRGLPHLAVSANMPARSGLAQLRRVAAALWTEGASPDLGRLDMAPPARREKVRAAPPIEISLGAPLVTARGPLDRPAPPAPAGDLDGIADLAYLDLDPTDPLAVELGLGLASIRAAQRDVVAAFLRAPIAPPAAGPHEITLQRSISVDDYPELHDHAFYRQPEGWPALVDRYPVVPMTMILELMREIAEELVPGKIAVGLSGVRAYRWMAVAPPVDLTITARHDGACRVELSIEGFAAGAVELADAYPAPPPRDLSPLTGEAAPAIDAPTLYADRWMFHGPAYQGVLSLDTMANDGIRGRLASLRAKGGLLDNAGQLLGYWVMEHAENDRLAMPVMLERVRFFSPAPPVGEDLDCTVWIRRLSDTDVRADVELCEGDRVFCRIDGWEDRRFDSDARVWAVLRYPEQNLLAVVDEQGRGLVKQPWKTAASRDLLARRYLSEREREAHAKIDLRRQGEWLLGRMALKDCARRLLWERGHGPIFPIEIEVETDPAGLPRLRGPLADRLVARLAVRPGYAAAWVGDADREVDLAALLDQAEPRGE
ncbi:MAG: beta-ketoacyl synthase N-terminal-like domain-containing protein [Byssovorax sp.]